MKASPASRRVGEVRRALSLRRRVPSVPGAGEVGTRSCADARSPGSPRHVHGGGARDARRPHPPGMRACPSAVALTLALVASPQRARADDVAEKPRARSVYRLRPAADAAIGAVAGAAALAPYLLQGQIIHERCPCDRSEVPRFERFVIGYRSNAADHASDALAALAIVAPFALDAGALGFGRTLLEDGVVLAETLLVNGAIVTTVKDLVQRPTPRAYAGDAAIVSRASG
jgi:hypothetical protein